jgi:threonyl-tRNA synthetase
VSTRPASFLGELETWDAAETALMAALDAAGLTYKINKGDGAFYGPKIDFKVRDALRRSWQLGTCQLDFQLPERFGLEFVDAEDKRGRPVMIHRAMLGSLERFFGVYLEHVAGRFPTWLAPVQVAILPITDAHAAWANEVEAALTAAGLRAGRSPQREARPEDPRGDPPAGPLHAGARRQGSGGPRRGPADPRRQDRRTGAPGRVRRQAGAEAEIPA